MSWNRKKEIAINGLSLSYDWIRGGYCENSIDFDLSPLEIWSLQPHSDPKLLEDEAPTLGRKERWVANYNIMIMRYTYENKQIK